MAADCYNLDDLRNWSHSGTFLAVLGFPVRHSLSPEMHNAALAAMATENRELEDWRYVRIEIETNALAEALQLLFNCGFKGVNLTLPHKVNALPSARWVDPTAFALGAVNTLRRGVDGWEGFNTDGFGIEMAIHEELGCELRGASIIQLGAGGAARAVAMQCLRSGCRELWIGNRSAPRLFDLLKVLSAEAGQSAPIHGFDLSEPPASLPRDGILINVTSLGLKAEDPVPIGLDRFSDQLKVYDCTYGNAENRLLIEARARGMRAADGLGMLVWQGARSLELWTGMRVPAEIMRAAAEHALRAR